MQNVEIKEQPIETKTKLEETLTIKEKPKPKKKKIQMVRGIFRNWDCPGSPVKFTYSADKTPAEKYEIKDHEERELPLEVAKHLNRCSYPVSEAELDKHGVYVGHQTRMVKRYTFRRIDDLLDNIS